MAMGDNSPGGSHGAGDGSDSGGNTGHGDGGFGDGNNYGGDGGGDSLSYWQQQQAEEEERRRRMYDAITKENELRQNFLNTVNRNIGNRNAAVANLGSELGNMKRQINGLDINSVQNFDADGYDWMLGRFNAFADDRLADFKPENAFSYLPNGGIRGVVRNPGDMTFNRMKSKLDFEGDDIASAEWDGKTVNLLRDPTYASIDGVNNLIRQFNEYTGNYDSLMGERNSALDADQEYRDTMTQMFGDFTDDFNRADIWDTGVLDGLYQQFKGLRNDARGYESLLNDADFSGVAAGLDAADALITGAQGTYDTEVDRVDNLLDTWSDDNILWGNAIGDLTIADQTGMDDYEGRIDNRMAEMLDFSSPLDTDISSYMSNLANLDTSVDQLRDARAAEEDQISRDRAAFLRQIAGIGRDIGRSDMYSGNALDSFEDSLSSIEDQIGSYDSLLNPQFDTSLANIDEQFGNIDQLWGERTDALTALQDQIASILGTSNDAELYQEDVFNEALDDLDRQGRQLARFTGRGLDDAAFALDDATDAVGDRLTDLSNYRTDLESQAQDLLDSRAGMGNRFMDQGALDAFQASVNPLQEEIELYDAFEANNEMSNLLAMLEEGQYGINTDAASVQAREDMEARQALADLFGGSFDREYIANQLATGNIRGDEYTSLMRKLDENDPDFAAQVRQQYDALYA